MMFPRVPFSSVVYKDEFGDTNPTFSQIVPKKPK
jgi:hypothetical protein